MEESPYQASIGGMRPRLVELQVENGQVWKIRVEKLGRNWEDLIESYIIKDCPIFLKLSELSWLAFTMIAYKQLTLALWKCKNLSPGSTTAKP